MSLVDHAFDVASVLDRPEGLLRPRPPGDQWFALDELEKTTKTHVAHVLSKLDLRDRVQTVVVAYETGLVARELSPGEGGPA